MTNALGNILLEYDYDVFGNTFVVDGSGSLINIDDFDGELYDNSRLYTSREYDNVIRLYFLRARYYDSEIGRFISRDPIEQVDDVNLYAYVGNNGVMYIDPSGELKQILAGATMGDYNENANGWSIVGQIAVGFTPVGIAGDVRDFSYQWENGSKTDIGFSMVAFIPGIGDGFKGFRKLFKFGKKVDSKKLVKYQMKGIMSPSGKNLNISNKKGIITIGGKNKGTYDFINQNSKIKVGLGHSVLANGKSVNYAGTLSISNGKITSWSNYSGHYMPKSTDLVGKKLTNELFQKQHGIKLNNFKSINF